MCVVELEQSELWSENDIRARTPKVCTACDGPIKPGEIYVKHFSKHDGSLNSEVMCGQCKADRAMFADAHDGMSPTPGYFHTMLTDCVEEEELYDGPEPTGEDAVWAAMLKRMKARGALKSVGISNNQAG